jgi:hypothetical protein
MGCDPTDIGKNIHPHPTLGESIGMATEVFEGVCHDLPPVKKKMKRLVHFASAAGGVGERALRIWP